MSQNVILVHSRLEVHGALKGTHLFCTGVTGANLLVAMAKLLQRLQTLTFGELRSKAVVCSFYKPVGV